MYIKRSHTSTTIRNLPSTRKMDEEGGLFFRIYRGNGIARSITDPCSIKPLKNECVSCEKRHEPKDTNCKLFSRTRILYSMSNSKNSHILLGEDMRTKSSVVIKLIDIRKKENRRQAESEVKILSHVSHRNIIKCFGSRIFLDSASIYLEYFKGVDLFCILHTRRVLPVRMAMMIFKELVLAVAHLHENKVCHLDIKPENILVNRRNEIKLIDFGMSQRTLKSGLVEAYGGSMNYASPEAIAGGVYNGFLADSWSCGVVLFLMVNGYFPAPPNTLSLSHVPNEIVKILNSLLAISPGRRIPIRSLVLQ
ncbi:hypothetical protein NEMIN01_0500 [Nematocida minor]|uniref:uncharacterized protein n=1 Tax=Nematocida minor TaxID=1912983 RepID=UPI00222027EA|nr:uncharacterized protein NEMIN01_0500 [Nematocida minor]KAI5189437.1 hypothetical protein NEMIN01_0500 [Nematocida minor]